MDIWKRHVRRLIALVPVASLFISIICSSSSANSATNDEQISEVARQVLEQGDYQTEILRVRTSRAEGKVGAENKKGAGNEVQKRSRPESAAEEFPDERVPEDLSTSEESDDTSRDVYTALLWVLAGAALALLVFFVCRELLLRFRSHPEQPNESDIETTVRETAIPSFSVALEKADELAAQGRHSHAIRLLLLLCISTLMKRVESSLRPSLTNRELLRRAPIPSSARNAFGIIVSAEELSQFGGKPLNDRVYGACREKYRQFIAELGETA